ncbi:MAG: hypothetical protein D6712_11260, partial [Chloroflexi bacterium]
MKLHFLIILCCLFLLTACSGENIPGTLRADNASWSTEIAQIPPTLAAYETEVAATVVYASTYVAEVNQVNGILAATARAGATPTVARVTGIVPEAAEEMREKGQNPPLPVVSPPIASDGGEVEMMDDMVITGPIQIIDLAMTSVIRESDGCAARVQTSFPLASSQIFIAARARNVQNGTSVEVEWFNESRLVLRDSWTIPVNAEEYC